MSNLTFPDFTAESSPLLADYLVGYRTNVAGGERRTALTDILTLFKQNTTTGSFVLTGNGLGGFSNTDLTYSTPTLTVPDAFNVSGAGSISLTAGGSNKNVTLTPSGTGVVVCPTNFLLSAAAGNFRTLQITSGGGTNYRWLIGADNATESGTNAGSNFGIRAYDDSGNFLGTWIGVTRSSGIVSIPGTTASTTTTTGALTVGGGLGVVGDIFSANFTATNATIPIISAVSTAASSGSGIVRARANSNNVEGFIRAYSASSGGSTLGVTNTSTVNFMASGSSALGVMYGATTNIPAYFGINNAEIFRLTGTTLRMASTNLITFGATALATIGVSADTTSGVLTYTAPSSGQHRFVGGMTIAGINTQTSSTYTILATDNDVIFNASGTCTVTLGTATAGRTLWLRTIAAQTVVSASSNVIPLVGGAAGTAILAGTAGKWAKLVGDGTNWQIQAAA